MPNTTFIYALQDPRDLRIRYVGKADNMRHRLGRHLLGEGRNKAKDDWVRGLKAEGLKPDMLLLQEVPKSAWEEAERSWIAELRARDPFALTNVSAGGSGGIAQSAEVRAHMSAISKVRCSTPEFRAQRSSVARAMWADPDIRSKQCAAFKVRSADPEYRAKKAASVKAWCATPEVRAMMSATGRALWDDPEFRARQIAAAKERETRPEFRAARSCRMKALWADPNYREKVRLARASPEYRAKMSAAKVLYYAGKKVRA